MLASELIQLIQEQIDKYGDHPMCDYDGQSIRKVWFDKYDKQIAVE